MGLFSWIRDKAEDAYYWAKRKVEDAVDWVRDKLSGKKYDESDVADHVDVDAVLAEFRKSINDDIVEAEQKCMNDVSSLFSDLIERTQEKFPDLVEIIKNEQDKAERELKGTIMKYVKEHLSKNDPKFLKVLKMNPGSAKSDALKLAFEQSLENAEKAFNSRLKKYTEYVLSEFTSRLNSRISDQEERMSQRIGELEILQAEAESGQIDVDALKDSSSPVMESAQCIIQMLEMEM